jgi:hypothetical protein
MAGKRKRVSRGTEPINNSAEDLAAIAGLLREYFLKSGGRVVSHAISERLVRGSPIYLTINMTTYTNLGQAGAMGDRARSNRNKFIGKAPAQPKKARRRQP